MGNSLTGDRTRFSVLGAISFSHFLNDMLQSLIVSIYPLLKGTFTLNFVQIGMITLTYQLTAMGTLVEGPVDALLKLTKELHDATLRRSSVLPSPNNRSSPRMRRFISTRAGPSRLLRGLVRTISEPLTRRIGTPSPECRFRACPRSSNR